MNGPTNSWKILSDDKWVMVPNRVGCFKWWVMSDEWWKLSDEWWVMKTEWWVIIFLNQTRPYNHTNRKIECENSHVHTSVDWSIDQPHTTSTLCRVNEKIRSHGTDLFWFFFYFGVSLGWRKEPSLFCFFEKGKEPSLDQYQQ